MKEEPDGFAHGQADDDSEDEGFQYPGHESYEIHDNDAPESDEEFTYPAHEPKHAAPDSAHEHETNQEAPADTSPPVVQEPSAPPQQSTTQITPAQLEALYAAGLDGNMTILKQLVDEATSGDLEPFTFVNSASPRTGLTVVHAAASRGRLDALKYRMSLQVSSSWISLTRILSRSH